MGLMYYISEYPVAGRLFFKVICIFFSIRTICRRVSGREGWMFRRRESLFANWSRSLRVYNEDREKITPRGHLNGN